MGVETATNKAHVKTSPAGIYRPPNLRKIHNETVSADENPENSYVPPNTALNTTLSSATAVCDSKPATADNFNNHHSHENQQNFKHSSPHRISNPTDHHRESLNAVTNVGKSSPSTSPESNDSQLLKQNRTRERRPDRAVYVPRARRSQTVTGAVTIPSETVTPQDVKIKDLTNAKIKKLSSTLTKSEKLLVNHNKHKSSDNACDIESLLQKDVLSANTASCNTVINNLSCDLNSNSNKISTQRVSIDNLDKILVNSPCIDKKSECTSLAGFQSADNSNSLQTIINLQQQTVCDWTPNTEQQLAQNETKRMRDKLEDNVKLLLNKIDSTNGAVNDSSSSTTTPTSTSTNSPEIQQQPDQQLLFDENPPPTAPSIMDLMNTQQNGVITATLTIDRNGHDHNDKKEDRDEKILRRQSQEMNRSNRRLIKQTFNSDILEICDEQHNNNKNSNEKASLKPRRKSKKSVKLSTDETHRMSPEEDDWETMFDDNGDCLDPKLMDELTLAVGKVTIVRPQNNYKIYQSKEAILDREEYPHVLEASNFPIEFKTSDIMMIFSQYKESGFDIKWVDDTHALVIFSSSKIAAEVLAMGHPFVSLKPLADATLESRTKAKKCSHSLQPYRPRPETCAALARRLVSGALGVKLKTAREERENERKVLREAKERKLLAAKQRDEMWEN